MSDMWGMLSDSEFWMSIAFVLVVVVSARPFIRFVLKWAKKEAEIVESSLKEASDVRKKALDLLNQYQNDTQSQSLLRRRAMAEADEEIAVLQLETDQKTNDAILHKKQETALHLKMIEENSHQNIQNKMVRHILTLTERNIVEQRDAGKVVENMDRAIEDICQALSNQIPT